MNGKTMKAVNVCKSYGDKEVLKNLNVEIEAGKIYGLIGRNGVGKTTLLGILTAQNTMNSGEVTYGGESVWENQNALNEICFSRELQPTLFTGQNTLKIKDYMKFARLFYPNWDEEYAKRLLAEFELEPKKKIYQLSKGQMSAVTILIALASRAPFTILDEPAAGLDVVARERFYQLLLEDYMETNRTFVVSTHIIEEAASVFERVIILDEGKVIENCPTEELLAQFCGISGHEDTVDEVTRGMEVLSEQVLGRHKMVTVRADAAKLAAAKNADVDITPLSLQKVFVALCGHEDERK